VGNIRTLGSERKGCAPTLHRRRRQSRRFPFATCRVIELGGIKVLASRISYIGELGWEIYVPIEEGARAWSRSSKPVKVDGLVPVGIGVYATTGRLEKGYRALHGNELTADYTHRLKLAWRDRP